MVQLINSLPEKWKKTKLGARRRIDSGDGRGDGTNAHSG
jgi:hypothetical protein